MNAIGLASSNPYTDDVTVVAEEARQAQDLGYATLWRSGDLPMIAAAVRATSTIPVATGIIAVSRVPAADVIALYDELEPGRFVVGIGGAHGPRPLESIGGYLDDLDAAGIRAGVLAALGPNMLTLARERAGGAYPYLVTPEYVRQAKAQIGADRTLAVLQMVIPLTDRDEVRRAASGPLEFLAWKPGGYRRNLLRQGFTEADIDQVSDRLLDGITAWGEPRRIAERVAEYQAAGADEVVLRIVGADDIAEWRAKLAATLLNQ